MSYIVLPEFTVSEENLDAFLEAATEDATRSVADEPDCHQFDVCVDRSVSPVKVVFYEVYTDRAGFEAHLETPHLAVFRDKLHLCTQGPVVFMDRVAP